MKKTKEEKKRELVVKAIGFIINEFKTRATPRNMPNENQIRIFTETLMSRVLVSNAKDTSPTELLTLSTVLGCDSFTKAALKAAKIKKTILPKTVMVEINFKENRFSVSGDSIYMESIPTFEEDLERVEFLRD